jgi:hypothetical protein
MWCVQKMHIPLSDFRFKILDLRFMFGKEYDFSLIRTSSKEALLRSALMASSNDIKKATEICDYVTKMLPNLPDTDPVVPSSLEQIKDTAIQLFQWGQEHQDQIVGVSNIVMRLLGRQPIVSPTEVPPPINV